MTIDEIQIAIANRLTASDTAIPSPMPANGEVKWFTEDIGDLANKISRVMGKLGICGTVMTPHGKLIKPGEGPGVFLRPMIEVQVQENVLLNRGASGTKIAAGTLRDFVMKRLHWWSPTNQRVNRLELDEVPYLLVAETPTLVYNVRLNAYVTL